MISKWNGVLKMNYSGFAIRKKRLENNWSQEGLCKGICTVSYLSKIEQGKADASEEVIAMLFGKLGIEWITDERILAEGKRFVEEWYDAVLSEDVKKISILQEQFEKKFWILENSSFAIDVFLLKALDSDERGPLDEKLEVCMNSRQLSFQRLLGGHFTEAEKLYPSAFIYLRAGYAAYEKGDNFLALEKLQKAYELASEEGRVRVMMMAKLYTTNCYSNIGDIEFMEYHGKIAKRLALTLDEHGYAETVDYNFFATKIEVGDYKEAYDYFSSLAEPSAESLHKLAVCCEKLGKIEEAFAAIERVKNAKSEREEVKKLSENACEMIRFRLLHEDYLSNAEYGKILLEFFDFCRRELPIGYAKFHLPWVLEWYTANRQYKLAYELLNNFPNNIK